MAETETPEITRVTAAILINDEKVIIAKKNLLENCQTNGNFPGARSRMMKLQSNV